MLIHIVVPCYNEEEVLPWSVGKLTDLTERIKKETDVDAKLVFVDDGSKDKTWELIEKYSKEYSNVAGIKLAHNAGHQNAVWAGIEQSIGKCDATVSIDADLQDDENTIIDMTKQLLDGCDIIYGVRKERKTDTFFKRFTAQAFYKLMQTADKEILYNHADFRMMSNRAGEALISFPERNLFLRGIVRKLGFKEGYVYYSRTARTAGESKYPLRKMIQFSIEGITSFSVAPLKMITLTGFLFIFISFLIILYGLFQWINGDTIPGWASLLVSLWFIGGIAITGIGIIGLYVGKIYTEVKRRPRYFVDTTTNMP